MKVYLFSLNTYWLRLRFNPIAYLFNFFLIVLIVLIFSFNNTLAATHQPQPVSDDTESPTVIITSPTTGQSFFAGAIARIKFRSTDNVGVVSQNIFISTDGINFMPIFTGLDGDITLIDFMLPMTTSTNAILRVEALDAAGNMGFALVPNFLLLADTLPPIVKVIAPQANVELKGNSMFTIIFSSSDNVGVARHDILIALDGKNFTPLISGIEGDAQAFTVQVPNIKAKSALIRVIATDEAGNVGKADSEAFAIKRVKKHAKYKIADLNPEF